MNSLGAFLQQIPFPPLPRSLARSVKPAFARAQSEHPWLFLLIAIVVGIVVAEVFIGIAHLLLYLFLGSIFGQDMPWWFAPTYNTVAELFAIVASAKVVYQMRTVEATP